MNPADSNKSGNDTTERLGRPTVIREQMVQRRKELARSRLNQAFNFKVQGQEEEAKTSLADAVRTDPELATDPGAVGLAQSLYDITREGAIAMLHAQSSEEIVESIRPQFKVTPEFWETLIEVTILFLILLVFSAVLNMGVLQAASSLSDRTAVTDTAGARLRGVLSAIKPGDLLPEAFRSAILWLVSTLLGIFVAYIVGSLMGGVGTVGKYLRYLTRVYVLFFVVATAGLGIALAGLATFTNASGSAPNVTLIGAWILYISGAVSLFGLGFAAGRAHAFGFFKALGTIFLGNIIVGLLVTVFGLFRT